MEDKTEKQKILQMRVSCQAAINCISTALRAISGEKVNEEQARKSIQRAQEKLNDLQVKLNPNRMGRSRRDKLH